MIKSWQHKGLKLFYETGSVAKIQPHQAQNIHDILQALDVATKPEDMRFPGLMLHKLTGGLKHFYAVQVSGNWRIIFRFAGKDAVLVDYTDYH
jgi:proteic killer suppression protein